MRISNKKIILCLALSAFIFGATPDAQAVYYIKKKSPTENTETTKTNPQYIPQPNTSNTTPQKPLPQTTPFGTCSASDIKALQDFEAAMVHPDPDQKKPIGAGDKKPLTTEQIVQFYKTPGNIEKLAKLQMRCSNAVATAPAGKPIKKR